MAETDEDRECRERYEAMFRNPDARMFHGDSRWTQPIADSQQIERIRGLETMGKPGSEFSLFQFLSQPYGPQPDLKKMLEQEKAEEARASPAAASSSSSSSQRKEESDMKRFINDTLMACEHCGKGYDPLEYKKNCCQNCDPVDPQTRKFKGFPGFCSSECKRSHDKKVHPKL